MKNKEFILQEFQADTLSMAKSLIFPVGVGDTWGGKFPGFANGYDGALAKQVLFLEAEKND